MNYIHFFSIALRRSWSFSSDNAEVFHVYFFFSFLSAVYILCKSSPPPFIRNAIHIFCLLFERGDF